MSKDGGKDFADGCGRMWICEQSKESDGRNGVMFTLDPFFSPWLIRSTHQANSLGF